MTATTTTTTTTTTTNHHKPPSQTPHVPKSEEGEGYTIQFAQETLLHPPPTRTRAQSFTKVQ